MSDEFIYETRDRRVFAPSSMPVAVPVDPELEQEYKKIPDKMAFKIGEVAEIVDVKPYVLRYWETEFDCVKPKKSKHNQRMYEKKDVKTLLLIKKLLYKDRFSIEGARTALKKMRQQGKQVKPVFGMTEFVEDVTGKVEDLLEDIREMKKMIAK